MAALTLSCRLGFADMALTTYYPSLSGGYSQFRLVPRSADLTNPCTIGTLYVNSSNTLQYCHDNSGTGAWGAISDTWTQNGDDIYLTDTATNPNLHLGIGTKTPEFKLSLSNDAGIIAKGTFGSGTLDITNGPLSVFVWCPRKASVRAGYLEMAQSSSIGNYSVALGKGASVTGTYSVVGGGDTNTASGQYSTVIGGKNNTAMENYSSITGGFNNMATQQYTTITGGALNNAISNYVTIIGGQNNQASAIYATIGGGSTNRVQISYSNINGGKDNRITGITGYSIIGGGLNNQILSNDYSVISGGQNNVANNSYTSVGGGQDNMTGVGTNGSYARVSGGQGNHANTDYSIISGGNINIAMNNYAVIGGGLQNTASGAYSVVSGGEGNAASGDYAMILGGTNNIAPGDYSWAGGKNMQLTATADRTFAWGYSDTPVSISAVDAFIIAAGTTSGPTWNPNVGIRDINPTGVVEINANSTTDDYINIKRNVSGDVFIVKNNGYIGINRAVPSISTYAMQVGTLGSTSGNGAYLDSGGHWMSTCSRKAKQNIQPLTSQAAQETLDKLNPVTFNYNVSPQTNAGFIAEDVPEIVALKGRQALNAMDIIAILTKAAQDQEAEIKNQTEEINEIQKTIAKLKKASQK